MKTSFRTAIKLGGALCCLALQIACHAQSAVSATERSPMPLRSDSEVQHPDALNLLAAKGEEETGAASAAPANPSASAPGASSSAATPLTNDAVIKELTEMKARIAQLEAELRSRDGAADAERNANALRTAVGAAMSGGQAAL